jgi:hypothetical protein
MSGPSNFLLATFQAGDQVSVQVQAFSCDPNESGENEPIVLQTSTGNFTATIGTYGFTTSYPPFKATAGGVLTGFISGADSNSAYCATPYDETATVTVTTTPHPKRFSQATKDQLNTTKVTVETVGATAAAVAFVCTVIPELVSKVCAVGGGGIAAASGLIIAGIDVALALDPPDLNFMQIAQPVLFTLPPLLAQPGNITQAEADAYNALLLNMEQQLALIRAIITSENRAQSAHDAGNAFWEAQQVTAINVYSSQLGVYFGAEPALLANFQATIIANGDPPVALTSSQVLSFEQSIAANGLPPAIMNALNLLGADTASISQVKELLIVQNVNAIVGSGGFPSFLTQPAVIAALKNASQSLPFMLGPGLCTPFPVTLATPAAPGGSFITLTSSDSSTVTVGPGNGNSETLFIPSGASVPQRMPNVCGVNFGSAAITATGGISSSQTIQVTGTLTFSPASSAMTTTRQDRLTLFLSSPAPAGGVAVNLSSDNPSVATVNATVTIPAGTTSVIVPVTGVAAGSTVIHANAMPNVPDTTASVTVM